MMLILAREARCLTQMELVAKSGIAQATLSRYEHDIIAPTPEHLECLVKILDFPASFFEQSNGDVVSGLVFHRKKAALAVKSQRLLIAESKLRLAGIKKLSKEIDYTLDIPPVDFERIGEDPNSMARLVRQYWKVPRGPIKNIVALVESKGISILRFDFGSSLLDGFTFNDDFYCIVINSRMPMDRQRFTIAHELGHLLMHEYFYDEAEDQANRFAAEFLMPADDIEDDLRYGAKFSLAKLAALKEVWRVSMGALLFRAKALDIIPASTHLWLTKEMSSRGYRRSEPYPLTDEKPVLLNKIVQVCRDSLAYTNEELMKIMHLNQTDYNRFFIQKPANEFDSNRSFFKKEIAEG